MGKKRQLSFAGGVLAPSLQARVDLIKYATGLYKCENFQVMRQGGVTNRAGTQFVGEVENSSEKSRIIPFIFNSTQTYVLEFGNLYMRVHKNGAQLTEAAKAVTGATQANPCVLTVVGHSYATGSEIQIANVVGMTELNNRNFKVTNLTANTFSIQNMDGSNTDSTGFSAYTSGGNASKVYEIVTPYTETEMQTLKHVQSADIVTLTHPNHAPRELSRAGDISWSLASIIFGATIAAPASPSSDAAGTTHYYKVTAVDIETSEESLPTAEFGSTSDTSTLSWTTVSTAGHYNVYKKLDKEFGWIGLAGQDANPTFKCETAYTPDMVDNPPVVRTPFSGANDYPGACTFYQQRQLFANTNNDTEGVWSSKSTLRKNLMKSTPMQDDDPVTFSMFGRQVNAIEHLLDLGRLFIFTSSGEWVIEGDQSGILSPTGINPRQISYNGISELEPIAINNTALYVQARGTAIRDLGYSSSGTEGSSVDLSIFAAHFFDGYTIVDWAYQQMPNSIVWCVRSDGSLLGLTYIKEHEVIAWHKHTFQGGSVKNVCVVPEGSEDVLYLIIERTINGKTVKYVERMNTRLITDIKDAVFMDSTLSFDGRMSSSGTTVTLSGGTTWKYDETITCTASAATFTAASVGEQVLIYQDGIQLKFTIDAYTNTTTVTGKPNKTVPIAMRGVSVSTWDRAVLSVGGLWHIEGEDVSVLVDGYVSANPNNNAYDTKTVTNGTISFDDPHSVVHAGLPIIADMETLNIDNAETVSGVGTKKLVNEVTVHFLDTRGGWLGSSLDIGNLVEWKKRRDENYDDPVALSTNEEVLALSGNWNSSGRVLIRQTDPLPMTVLSVTPSGLLSPNQ